VTAAGEVVWVGVESLGERDGRVALYLADHVARLLPPAGLPAPGVAEGGTDAAEASDKEQQILEYLRRHGASFFGPLHESVGAGYPADTVDALWNLVWQGLITNDTFHPLRAFTRVNAPKRAARRPGAPAPFRSRRLVPPSAEGRWSLVPRRDTDRASAENSRSAKSTAVKEHTRWAAAVTQQLLARHGVLTRESVIAEATPGGFGTVYTVLKNLEDAGRIRRGYFVAGLGATQFALPGALDLLRSMRDVPTEDTSEQEEVVVLAATDPANPYGATLKWPAPTVSAASPRATAARGPTRSVGATVILVAGSLAAYLARGDRFLTTFLPDAEPARSKVARAVARVLIDRARSGFDAPRGMLIEEVDGLPPAEHPMRPALIEAGFVTGAMGLQATLRVRTPSEVPPATARDFTTARRPSRSTVSSPFASRYLAGDGDDDQSDA